MTRFTHVNMKQITLWFIAIYEPGPTAKTKLPKKGMFCLKTTDKTMH